MASSDDDPWRCSICRAELPVPSIKTTHERRCRREHGLPEDA